MRRNNILVVINNSLVWILFFCSKLICCSVSGSVSYDGKSIIINGQRRILISGSIHYPRSTSELHNLVSRLICDLFCTADVPGLIQKAKLGGLDVIQTYVFWDGHEPSVGNYYFEGRYDLVQFVKLIHQARLYVHLRIGPYVCAEWNFGGLPVWLKFVPGIEFRTDNGPFKDAMQKFTTKIVDLMKSENLFASQGGPIILSQIENEYELMEWEIGAPGKSYMEWLSKMAVGLNTGVPWVMCKQENAPDPIINTCNGFYCENFNPNKDYKPKMFTENWTGWFTAFGGPTSYRPVEDLALSVVKFIQNNGSFINYYMYHGGTNFGRTSSGLFIANSYDYDAPIDEYGLIREPKWSHLKYLHKAIKLAEPALVSSHPTISWPAKNLEVHVFQSKIACAAFLANYDSKYPSKITFLNKEYSLPPWSISILPDCKTGVFNTAKVTSPQIHAQMLPISDKSFSWESYVEQVASLDDPQTLTKEGLWDQVDITWDKSDYLWYMIDVSIQKNEAFLNNRKYPILSIMSTGHVLHVFINGKLLGTKYGSMDNQRLMFNNSVQLVAGVNKISLLSVSVGLYTGGSHFERHNTGVLGPVTQNGLNEGTRDLTKWKWSYKVGLKGSALNLHTTIGSSSIKWTQGSFVQQKQPLTWYKTTFNAPVGKDPLAFDMSTMGKGEIWVNGQSIGRHWPGYIANGDCSSCNYATFYEKKCYTNCGQPSQRWYHVPRSWVKSTGNLLVVFEEWGGDPSGIHLVKRQL